MAKIVSERADAPLFIVMLAIKSFYENINNEISKIDFDEIDPETFSQSFNIQYIGKLYTNPMIIKAIKNRKKK